MSSIQSLKSEILKSENGFTLFELLISTFLGLAVLSISIGTFIAQNDFFQEDTVRNRIQSNLRPTMTLLADSIRQTGEHLGSNFPAVILERSPDGESSVLTIRRARTSHIATVCGNLASGDSTIELSNPSSPLVSCYHDAASAAFETNATRFGIRSKTLGDRLNKSLYIYNSENKIGEFVEFTNIDMSVNPQILYLGSPVQNEYLSEGSHLYSLEQHKFYLDQAEETLKMEVDNNFLKDSKIGDVDVAYNIVDFEVEALYAGRTNFVNYCREELGLLYPWEFPEGTEDTYTGSVFECYNKYYAGDPSIPYLWKRTVVFETSNILPVDVTIYSYDYQARKYLTETRELAWNEVNKFNVNLSSYEIYKNKEVIKTVEASYYPRNSLSAK